MVIEEFLAKDPEIVLLNTITPKAVAADPMFDFISYYSSDPRFASRWQRYKEVKGSNEIRIFVRSDEP
jgi:hypothetical protein